jgi:hypothetical protein
VAGRIRVGELMDEGGAGLSALRFSAEMTGIEIQCAQEDARPAFVLDDVSRADFFRVTAPRVQNLPLFVLNKVKDFSVYKKGTASVFGRREDLRLGKRTEHYHSPVLG